MADPVKVTVVDSMGKATEFVPVSTLPPPPPPDPTEPPAEPGTPPDPPLAPGTYFQVFQVHSGGTVPEGDPERVLWTFNASRTPLADPPVDPANISWGHLPGRTRWNDKKDNPVGSQGADRIGYHTAMFFLQHTDRHVDSDTMHHDYLDAIRFHYADYGATNQINDRFMVENPFGNPDHETQGLAQYPYERVRPQPVLKLYPGCTILVKHLRSKKLDNGATSIKNQLLRKIVIPAADVNNPRTKWYYQLNGIVVATNDKFVTPANPDGVIAKLHISGVHPAYSYEVEGINTAGV